MGKVLSRFGNGYPGAASRSIDNVIISMKNANEADIPFGAAVFQKPNEVSCRAFNESTSTGDNFLGFAVRVPDKTPETYGSDEGVFTVNDPVDVLVRGSVVLQFTTAVVPGASVYIRKADGKYVTEAGASGTTLLLPNVTVRTASDGNQCAEVVLTKRNLM